jgi:opacity protein-like surface antigen
MRHFFLTAVAVVAMCGTAVAADLTVAEVPAEAPAASSINGYVQLMGGWVIPSTMDYFAELPIVAEGTVDFEAGWALGATFGLETPVDGLSLEVDVLRTWADAPEGVIPEGSLISTSLMANAVYSVDLNDTFSLYGGAGLGMIALEAVPEDEVTWPVVTGSGAGYQVFAGVQADVAENVALTFEGRYQSSIDNIEMSVDEVGRVGEQEFNRTSVLVGLLFSF